MVQLPSAGVDKWIAEVPSDVTLASAPLVRFQDAHTWVKSSHELEIITAPLIDKTHGLVDKYFLAAMDDGALLVNAGRGRIVVTDALVAELQSDRLRAASNVTEPEPLPDDHPLWNCTNVIISPHAARTVPRTNHPGVSGPGRPDRGVYP
ncbi:NAD(P)-dependent oxidoreductase [Amycolatopsis sp. NPDC004772]